MKVIININLEIDAKEAKTIKEAKEIACNYELPHGYQEDTFEIVKVLKTCENCGWEDDQEKCPNC